MHTVYIVYPDLINALHLFINRESQSEATSKPTFLIFVLKYWHIKVRTDLPSMATWNIVNKH